MTIIINAIFAGSWGLIASLMVVQLLGLELNNRPAIITTLRNLLLLGSSVYLLVVVIGAFKVHMNFVSVRFWLTFFAWPFVFGVLPQLLWFNLSRRLSSLVTLAVIWTATLCFVPWSLSQMITNLILHPTGLATPMPLSLTGFLEIIAVYATLFAGVYYVLTLKNASTPIKALVGGSADTAEAA